MADFQTRTDKRRRRYWVEEPGDEKLIIGKKWHQIARK